MNLLPGWKYIVLRAWSIRWLVAAGVLTAFDVTLRIVVEGGNASPWLALAAGACTAAAGIARVTAQKNYEAENEQG